MKNAQDRSWVLRLLCKYMTHVIKSRPHCIHIC